MTFEAHRAADLDEIRMLFGCGMKPNTIAREFRARGVLITGPAIY